MKVVGGMEIGRVPTGQQQLREGGQAGRRTHPCVRGGARDSRRVGRVQALKCGICCHRVFLFRCKLGWRLTQLSPSTCLAASPSFHGTLHAETHKPGNALPLLIPR